MNLFTHRRYFQRYQLSVAQYGEILIAQAFRGRKMGDTQQSYDVVTSKQAFTEVLRRVGINIDLLTSSNEAEDIRIQVRSKLSKTPSGKARVIRCKASDLVDTGMTHLAVVLVDPGARVVHGDTRQEGVILHAWLMTRDTAALLRQKDGKEQYISVSQLTEDPIPSGVVDIKNLLAQMADAPLDNVDG